jgi:hypothetical protein
MLEDIGDGIA